MSHVTHVPTLLFQTPKETPPPPPPPRRNEAHNHNHNPTATIPPPMFSPAPIMLAVTSWLRTRRSRYIFLLLCSPILLPFLCATFPLLCAAEICIRICRRRRRKAAAPHESQEDERLRRCEEGGCCCGADHREEREVGLLQRYLEDQLLLVGSVYECGDEFDSSHGDVDNLHCKIPLLT